MHYKNVKNACINALKTSKNAKIYTKIFQKMFYKIVLIKNGNQKIIFYIYVHNLTIVLCRLKKGNILHIIYYISFGL